MHQSTVSGIGRSPLKSAVSSANTTPVRVAAVLRIIPSAVYLGRPIMRSNRKEVLVLQEVIIQTIVVQQGARACAKARGDQEQGQETSLKL